ncbi:MAG: hypothetical protein KVP17_000091 [Porospora cf. gigantea B]|nr:MAG: hypothetical protein KVP17_000091 [Porospora cf. gigantea B]
MRYGDPTAGISSESMALVESLFGDLRKVFVMLGHSVGGAEDLEALETRAATDEGASKMLADPAELAKEFLLESDVQIRSKDMPERYQRRFAHRNLEVTFASMEQEAQWISGRLQESMPEVFDQALVRQRYEAVFGDVVTYLPENKSVAQDVQEKVLLVLDLILKQFLEVPVIVMHKGHLLMPPLTEDSIWKTYELDAEWHRLHDSYTHICQQLRALRPNVGLSETFDTEEDVDDVRVVLQYDQLLNQPQDQAAVTATGRKKRRAPSNVDVIAAADRCNVQEAWRPYLLSPECFEANLEVALRPSSRFDGQMPHYAPDAPQLPGRNMEAVQGWCRQFITGPFDTESRVFDAMIFSEARRLAVRPRVRQLLRAHFRDICSVSFTTTTKGEATIDPSKDTWQAMRVFRKSLMSLLHPTLPQWDPPVQESTSDVAYRRQILDFERELHKAKELYLWMQHCEEKGYGSITVHPCDASSPPPWQPPQVELAEYKNRTQSLSTKDRATVAEEQSLSDREDAREITRLTDLIVSFYCVPGPGWGDAQTMIVKRLLEKEMLPVFRREAKALLLKKAVLHVTKLCHRELHWRMNVAPYARTDGSMFRQLDSEDEEDSGSEDFTDDEESEDVERVQSPKVCVMVPETETNRIHVVLIDRKGVMQTSFELDYLLPASRWLDPNATPRGPQAYAKDGSSLRSERQQDVHDLKHSQLDMNRLIKFMKNPRTHPDVVAVMCSEYHKTVEVFESAVVARARIKQKKFQFDVVWSLSDVPKLSVNSQMFSTEEKSNYTVEQLYAIAVARHLQWPLETILSLWDSNPQRNRLVDLPLHPLQSAVPRDKLAEEMCHVVVSMVARTGVDLASLRQAQFKQVLLQFVPGLGPRKAQELLSKVAYHYITQRKSLLLGNAEDTDENVACLGENVFFNAASSFIINGGEDEPLIDRCRIHPIESAAVASKMCRDACDPDSSDPIRDILENSEPLDDLDLDAYARILEERGSPRMLPYLQFVKSELQRPFRGSRWSWRAPAQHMVFADCLGEALESFDKCAESYIKVKSAYERSMTASLMPHFFPVKVVDYYDALRDFPLSRDREPDLPEGVVLPCRLVEVSPPYLMSETFMCDPTLGRTSEGRTASVPEFKANISTSRTREEFNLSCLRPHVASAAEMSALWSFDVTFASRAAIRALQVSSEMAASKRHRVVNHPAFCRMVLPKAIESLRSPELDVGCTWFCADSKAKLCILIKTNNDPFTYKLVQIREDRYETGGVGRELWLGDDPTVYKSLDEILEAYSSCLLTNLDELKR